MYVVSVTVMVKEAFADPFVEATLDNARETRKEPGNVRFDVSRCTDDPTRFLLYEIYRTAADFEAHHQSPHYLRWKEAVAEWMAQPRQGVKHESVFFGDAEG